MMEDAGLDERYETSQGGWADQDLIDLPGEVEDIEDIEDFEEDEDFETEEPFEDFLGDIEEVL